MTLLYEHSFLSSNGRQCTRCGADIHQPDPPHLCKDLQERMARQQQVISAIRKVLVADRLDLVMPTFGGTRTVDDLAESIYRVVSGRDLP